MNRLILFRNIVLFLFLVSVASFAAPWLGLSFKKTTYSNHLALDIKGVHPESGCFSVGITAGDTLIGVNGQKKIKLEILRDGKKRTVDAALTERPDDISSLMGSAIGSKIASFGENFYKNSEKRKTKPKATLLDFWATWCGPCRKTLPVLANIYKKYGDKGLEIIGISEEPLETLNAFYEKQHASPYPLYRDKTKDLWRRYGIRAVPTLMLLDKDGYIKQVWSGAPTEYMIEQLLKDVMD